MAKKIVVVVSQGQSANPVKRALEEEIVAGLLFSKDIEVTVIPNLYDLAPDSTGMVCLQGIRGPMVVCSWLYSRAAHWVLDRGGVRGQIGVTLLEEEEEDEATEANGNEEVSDTQRSATTEPVPNRKIYCLRLSADQKAQVYVDEIERISQEAAVATVEIGGLFGSATTAPAGNGKQPTNGNGHASVSPFLGTPADPSDAAPAVDPAVTNQEADQQLPADGGVRRIEETPARRWYPVIDFARCTNCLECLDFCLFGVYGVDSIENILVEEPDNCRKGCPACSRVCPENAIIFPQHKSPAIAGAPDDSGGGAFKIDLSRLFGAPEGVDTAVAERDEQLVMAGRSAVGDTVGVPKRQAVRHDEPKDDLDSLMDELDDLEL